MCQDSRTAGQIQGAITAEATLARSIETDPMSTPQQRQLDELDHRRTH